MAVTENGNSAVNGDNLVNGYVLDKLNGSKSVLNYLIDSILEVCVSIELSGAGIGYLNDGLCIYNISYNLGGVGNRYGCLNVVSYCISRRAVGRVCLDRTADNSYGSTRSTDRAVGIELDRCISVDLRALDGGKIGIGYGDLEKIWCGQGL